MSTPPSHSYFAPAARADPAAVQADADGLPSRALVDAILDGFPQPAFVLNAERQIVLANRPATVLLGRPAEALRGLRVGEAFACVHAAKTASGCGTSVFCRYCGAVRAVLRQQATAGQDVQECRITANGAEGLVNYDLRVWATPLALGGRTYTLFAVHDDSDRKRRDALERIFFHDLLNGVSGLLGVLEAWSTFEPDEIPDMTALVQRLARELLDEIRAQRDLASAERGELELVSEPVDVADLLARVCTTYAHHSAAQGKQLRAPVVQGESVIRTDPRLLARVVGNLVQNALEASQPGEGVRVAFVNQDGPCFTVHNPAVMPPEVQAQVFQRSFTTKSGRGHGLGTYGARLLTRRYLGGDVTFSSVPGEGTTFVVRLPTTPPRA